MTVGIVLTLVAVVAALLVSALCSAGHAAVLAMGKRELDSIAGASAHAAEWIAGMQGRPERLSRVNGLTSLIAMIVAAPGLTALGQAWLPTGIGSSWWAPLVVTTALVIFAGDLLPRGLAARWPARLTLLTGPPLRGLERLLGPGVDLFEKVSNQCVSQFAPASVVPMQTHSDREYLTMLDIGTKEGSLRPSEKHLIERTLELADRNLRELMTPRNDMCCLDLEMDLNEMKVQAMTMRHRRLPIHDGSLDSIVGVLNVRKLYLEPDVDLMMCVEPPSFVPETMTALQLLKSFLRGSHRMAMVVDEFGGVEGLVTLEDVVEEVFGEIYDEWDIESPSWEKLEKGVYRIRGFAHLADVSRLLGVELEADGIDTLGGWVTDQIGAIPRTGDRISSGPYAFQVEKVNRLRVASVLVFHERRRG